MTAVIEKVVAYIVHDGQLVVFIHRDFPLEVTGIQVPAGTVKPGEDPAVAVLREAEEETGIAGLRIVASLGVEDYDVRPSRDEVHRRHFFQLALPDGAVMAERWETAELHDGIAPPTWFVCSWLPVAHAHVLSAGFGARLASIVPA